MSTNVSTDLRSRRTRRQLQEALRALIDEKPFDKIQITEITDRAEVSRPAFYLHFHSKEDLLISHVDIVFDAFHAEVKREIDSGNIDRKQISILLFQYWEKYPETLHTLLKSGMEHILMKRLRLYAATVIGDIRKKKKKDLNWSLMQDYVIDFLAGGAYMLLIKWTANNMSPAAEQMGVLFYDLTALCEAYRQQPSLPA